MYVKLWISFRIFTGCRSQPAALDSLVFLWLQCVVIRLRLNKSEPLAIDKVCYSTWQVRGKEGFGTKTGFFGHENSDASSSLSRAPSTGPPQFGSRSGAASRSSRCTRSGKPWKNTVVLRNCDMLNWTRFNGIHFHFSVGFPKLSVHWRHLEDVG